MQRLNTRQIIFLMCLLMCPTLLLGQEGQDQAEISPEVAPLTTPPIVVVNAAGLDRALADIEYLFGSINRGDLTDAIQSLMNDIGVLKGLDPHKPLGVMIFLKPGLAPQPVPVVYLPLESEQQFFGALNNVPRLNLRKASEDQWKISVGEDSESWVIRRTGGYLFAAQEELTLERILPDPAQSFAGLSKQYDVAIDIRPANVPVGMRALIVSLLQSYAQTELQRREDGESDAAYALRKAQGRLVLSIFENLLNNTQSITIGLNVSHKRHQATLDVAFDTQANSPFFLARPEIPEKPSRFTAILDHPAMFACSINAELGDRFAGVLQDLLEAWEVGLTQKLKQMDKTAASDQSAAALADRIVRPLRRWIEAGNIEFVEQIRLSESGEVLVIWAIEYPGAAELEQSLRELADRLRARIPKLMSRVRIEYEEATIGGMTFHRIVPTIQPPKPVDRLSQNKAIYVGFGKNVIWLGGFGPHARDALRQAISAIKQTQPPERQRDQPPYRMRLSASRWVTFLEADKNPSLPQAFSRQNDTLRITYRLTKQGSRLRIKLQEGYIRLLALALAQGYDDSRM